MWDRNEQPEIAKARLLTASPEFVYQSLKQRADLIKADRYGYAVDETLGPALLKRNDQHITLALARYAEDGDLLAKIYESAVAVDPSTDWSMEVRVACLANDVVGRPIFDDAGLWLHERLDILASREVGPELEALALNPMAGKALGMMLKRDGRFSGLSDDSWINLISTAGKNPRLNIDNDFEDGPDITRFGFADGVTNVIMTAPVEIRSYWAVSSFLNHLNPFVGLLVKIDIRVATDRWSKVPFKDSEKDKEYTLTGLTYPEELSCLLAALFGQQYKNGNFEIAGSADSDSLAMRCAYYGNARLVEDDIKTGFARDGRAFVFAALCNTSVLSSSKARAALEENMPNGMWDHYYFRCRQYKERWPNFDATPVTTRGQEVAQDDLASSNNKTETLSREIQFLKEQVAASANNILALRGLIIWCFVGLVVAAYMFR